MNDRKAVSRALDKALKSLNARGVLARRGATCCSNCAPGILSRDPGYEAARAVVYTTTQAEAAWKDGGALYLNYFDKEDTDEAHRKLGYEIVKALHEQRVNAPWSGTPAEAILVEGFFK